MLLKGKNITEFLTGYLLLITLLCIPNCIQAQINESDSLSITENTRTQSCFRSNRKAPENSLRIGLAYLMIKEENLHPKVHRGFQPRINYSQHFKTNGAYYAIGGGFSRVKTTYENSASSTNVQVNSSLGINLLYSFHKNISFVFAPELNLNYTLSHYPNWDESHLYWANHLSAGYKITLEKKDRTHPKRLRLHWQVPLFSLISRPTAYRDYKIDPVTLGGILGSMHSNLEPAFIHKNFFSVITLERVISLQRLHWYFQWYYHRMQARQGDPIQIMSYQIGLNIKLKK